MTHRICQAIILATFGAVLARPARADLDMVLQSDFPATAYIDGHRAGTLPLRIAEIPPGKHVVALRLPTGAGRIWSITSPTESRLEKSLKFSWRGTELYGAAFSPLPPGATHPGYPPPPPAEPELDASLGLQPLSSTTTSSATPVDDNALLLPIGVEAAFEPYDALDFPIYAYVNTGGGFGFRPVHHPPHPPRPPATGPVTVTVAPVVPPPSAVTPVVAAPVVSTPVSGQPLPSPTTGAGLLASHPIRLATPPTAVSILNLSPAGLNIYSGGQLAGFPTYHLPTTFSLPPGSVTVASLPTRPWAAIVHNGAIHESQTSHSVSHGHSGRHH